MSGVDVTHRLEVVRCNGKWVVRLQTPTDGAQGKKKQQKNTLKGNSNVLLVVILILLVSVVFHWLP